MHLCPALAHAECPNSPAVVCALACSLADPHAPEEMK